MNIIERIHEEMRINLIFQILQFRLQTLMFQFLQHFFITERFKEKFDGDIEPYHQKGNDEMNKIAEHKRRIRKRSRFWKSSGTIWISHSPRTLFGIGFIPMHIPFLPRLFSHLNILVSPVLLHTKRQLSSLEIFGGMIGKRKRRKPTNHSYYKNQRNSILPVPFLKKEIGNQPIIV